MQPALCPLPLIARESICEPGYPHETFRNRVAVGVAYGSDIDQVRAALMAVAMESDAVCGDPEPCVRFRAFGTSSLNFGLLCGVDDPQLRGRVLDAVNTAVYKRFLAEGIEIPYAKQDLYIKEMPQPGESARINRPTGASCAWVSLHSAR